MDNINIGEGKIALCISLGDIHKLVFHDLDGTVLDIYHRVGGDSCVLGGDGITVKVDGYVICNYTAVVYGNVAKKLNRAARRYACKHHGKRLGVRVHKGVTVCIGYLVEVCGRLDGRGVKLGDIERELAVLAEEFVMYGGVVLYGKLLSVLGEVEKRDEAHRTVFEVIALTVGHDVGDGVTVDTGHLASANLGGKYVTRKNEEDVGVLAYKLIPNILAAVGDVFVKKCAIVLQICVGGDDNLMVGMCLNYARRPVEHSV